MKNWRPLLLSFLSLPSLWFSYSAQADPLIWKAIKGEQQLLLIGTIHLGDHSMYPLPAVVTQFLKTSDGLVLETDTEEPPEINLTDALLTREVLDEAQQHQLQALAKKLALNPHTLLNLPPWLSAVTIENTAFQKLGYDAHNGVDQTILRQAQQLNVPLLTLETMAEQLQILQSLPQNGKDLLIASLEAESSDETHLYQCLVQSWKQGDRERLLHLLTTSEWDDEVSQQLLYQRNQRWISRITDPSFLLPQGKYLVAVGTLHFIGQQNLHQLLTEHGYHVEQITKSKPVDCQ